MRSERSKRSSHHRSSFHPHTDANTTTDQESAIRDQQFPIKHFHSYYSLTHFDGFIVDRMNRQALYDAAICSIGREVWYNNEMGVVVARYWRRRTRQILYDIKVIRNDGSGPIVIHPKVAQEEIRLHNP